MKTRSKVVIGVCAVAALALLVCLYAQWQGARQQNQALSAQLLRMQGEMEDLQRQVAVLSAVETASTPRPTPSPSPAASISSLVARSTPSIAVLTPEPQTVSHIVYITKTGKKYHRSGCQYLKQSSIEIQLDQAIANGYGACSRCRP